MNGYGEHSSPLMAANEAAGNQWRCAEISVPAASGAVKTPDAVAVVWPDCFPLIY